MWHLARYDRIVVHLAKNEKPKSVKVSTVTPVGSNSVCFAVEQGNERYEVRYASDDAALAPHPEVAVAGLLLVAMASGEAIHLDGCLDATFEQNLDTVQDVYTTWSDALSRIRVISEKEGGAEESTQLSRSAGKTAMFFSGGVDSFYTLLKRRDEIDALIFVHGFDLSLEDRELRSTVSKALQQVADEYGKQLIEVKTTLKEITNRKRMTPEFANWELSHGSALASVAHLFQNQFERIYIPATHTYKRIYPFGSHPLLDPLWSSSKCSIVCDGCEAGRIEKCELICCEKPALQSLRVCWKNTNEAYNCGRCEKCMRTMLILKALGALDACNSFHHELPPRRVAGIWIQEERWERYYEEVLRLLKKRDSHPEMRRAIKIALHLSKMKRGGQRVRHWARDIKRAWI